MSTSGTFVRDDAKEVTYFIGEIIPDEHYGVFSFADADALDNNAAALEFMAPTIDEAMRLLRNAIKPKPAAKKAAPAKKAEPMPVKGAAKKTVHAPKAAAPAARRKKA